MVKEFSAFMESEGQLPCSQGSKSHRYRIFYVGHTLAQSIHKGVDVH